MILGDKASGYITTYDTLGRKIEGETRQCVHCQFTWIWRPGSGKTRGICTHCNGLICHRKACRDNCAPFFEIAMEMSSKYFFNPVFGIFMRK